MILARRPRPSDDHGMTLIELIMSIAILGLIIAPLTLAAFLAMTTTKAAGQKTTDSAAAQLASTYLAADVQSAAAVDVNGAGGIATPCGNKSILELQWTDAATGTGTAVTYDTPSVAAGTDQALQRSVWTTGSGCTLQSTQTLVPAIDPGTPPSATCSPDCTNPVDVSLRVTALSQAVHNSAVYSSYTFTLTASRRAG